MMKKKLLKTTCAIVACFAATICVVGCNDDKVETPNEQPPQQSTPVQYDVTFNVGEGVTGTVAAMQKQEGDVFTLPMADGLSKAGFTFNGWTDGVNTYAAGAEYTMQGVAVTFNAVWKTITFTVTFQVDGATMDTQTIDYASVAQKPTNPTQEGKIFRYWADANGNEFDFTTAITADMTLTAVWGEPSGQTYAVTFVKSEKENQLAQIGGTLPTMTAQVVGATVTLPENTLTFAHYSLQAWRVKVFTVYKDGTSGWENMETKSNYQPGETFVMPETLVQICAVWKANFITISFDANGGSGEMADYTAKQFNQTFSSNASAVACQFVAPVGKTFGYWSLDQDGSYDADGVKLTEDVVGVDDILTLYAQWVDVGNFVETIEGSWTNGTDTVDIVALPEADVMTGLAGYGILNGKYYMNVYYANGVCEIGSVEYTYYYGVTVEGNSLKFVDKYEYGYQEYTFTQKGALAQASISDFVGKWEKPIGASVQPWVITETEVRYNQSMSVANFNVIGNYLAISYGDSYIYTYVLRKDGVSLQGYYTVTESTSTAVVFNQGTFFTVTIADQINQIVMNGNAINEAKLATPVAPEGQVFDGWVEKGTQNKVNLKATVTKDLVLEATFKAIAGSSVKTFTGSYTLNAFQEQYATKLELNTDTGAIVLTTTKKGVDSTQSYTAVYDATKGGWIMEDAPDYNDWLLVMDGDTLNCYDDFYGIKIGKELFVFTA